MGRDGMSNNHDEMSMGFSGHVNMSRVVYMSGAVEEMSITQVIATLYALAGQSRDPIYLVISTYGGSVHDMFALYDTINIIKNVRKCPIRTIGLGKIMSAGVLLVSAGEKGYRMIGESAAVMMHPVSADIMGNVFQLMSEAKEVQRLHDRMTKALSDETGMTVDEINDIMLKNTDVYLDHEQVLKMGICDAVAGRDFLSANSNEPSKKTRRSRPAAKKRLHTRLSCLQKCHGK